MSTLLQEIEAQISGVKTTTARQNVGTVREIGDGVAKIEGLTDTMLNEMLDFENGITRYAKRIAIVDNNLTWPLTFLFGGTTFVTLLGTVWPQFATQLYGLFKAGKYRAAAESMAAVPRRSSDR